MTPIYAFVQRAGRAYQNGRLDVARGELLEARKFGEDHRLFHLLGLVEKKLGDATAAKSAFEDAVRLAPGDPGLNTDYGNFLADAGDAVGANARYSSALAADPSFIEAYYNRALLLQSLGRDLEALADIESCIRLGASGAKILSTQGNSLRNLGRMGEAAAAYDAALRLEPHRATALHGRARVALERGEAQASQLYQRALIQNPGDPDLVIGLAEALEAEGDLLGTEILEQAVDRNPNWILAHQTLARMKFEQGERTDFARHYQRSLERCPKDRDLHFSYWKSLSEGGRHSQALDALRNSELHSKGDNELLFMEATLTGEAEDAGAAVAMLNMLEPDDPQVRFALGRYLLKSGDAERAAIELERLCCEEPQHINGWAHLGLAWRKIGDPRQGWLSDQPGLIRFQELPLGEEKIARLAALLRKLHRTRSHPIGQSVRGGTQTRGRLFWRPEIEITALQDSLMEALKQYVDALPAADAAHPLLQHRDALLAIAGSWSVRLTGQGYHVQHIHPQGVVSSACYIALPQTASSEDHEGWLEIGGAPAELGLDLQPLAEIEPKRGGLALFPSYLFHGTRPFREGERMTVAFDVISR